MGFLRKLFGGGESKQTSGSDSTGFFFYVRCDHCGSVVRLRINKEWDLNRSANGFVWHKTIVDSRCFRQMPTVVHFDKNYQVVQADIQGGGIISQSDYEAATAKPVETSQTTNPDDHRG